MLTFYYTYPKLLDNNTGTILRRAKKRRLPKAKNIKTHNIQLKLRDALLDSVSDYMSDQGSVEKCGSHERHDTFHSTARETCLLSFNLPNTVSCDSRHLSVRLIIWS